MKLKILFVITVLLLGVNFVKAGGVVPTDRCGAILDTSGKYTLENDSNSSVLYPASHLSTSACFLINSSDIVLDCAGHTLTNNNVTGNTTGILIEGTDGAELTNITIENCKVSNFTWGVYAYDANNSITILNNTANFSTYIGFTSQASSYINFTNNTAYNNYGDGFTTTNSFYNTLDNNTVYNSSFGFILEDSSAYNTLTDNNASKVSIGFYTYYSYNDTLVGDTAGNNSWGFIADTGSTGNNFTNCTAYGNYWHGFLADWLANNNQFVNDTSYGNSYEGFYMVNSSYNNLINNTAYNNHEDGFLVGNDSSYITLTNNIAYNNTHYGFEIDNSFSNNLANNTAHDNFESGFYNYLSNFSNFTNNTAINNNDSGFYMESSYNNSLIDNLAYGNYANGFYVETSSGNNLTNNTAQENSILDLFVDPFVWSGELPYIPFLGSLGNSSPGSPFFLNMGLPTEGDDAYCNNVIDNLTGSGDRPINYTNTSVDWSNSESSEVVLCNADGSTLTNMTVHGSDITPNNGIILLRTANTSIADSNSSNNVVGVLGINSDDNNFTGINAENDFYAGFGQLLSNGNEFISNTESGGLLGGFVSMISNDTNFTDNTVSSNQMSGFAILLNSTNNSLTDNTVHNNEFIGTFVFGSDYTMITGDHYYANGLDFVVATEFLLDPLNLSYVIFDNPRGNYESYTNLSLNDFVQPSEAYAINWSTKPAAGDPPHELSFHDKFIDIQAAPGVVIDNVIWHWTDDEAAGIDENTLRIMQYNGSAWMGAPGQSLLDPAQNYISISNLSSFGVFGIFKQVNFTIPTGGGGGGCTGSIKTSIAATTCPGNSVVVLLTDSFGTPLGAGRLVTVTGVGTTLIGNTNSSGEVSFTLPRSGSYAIGGVACDHPFNYQICSVGCSSDSDCSDTQYCSSGTCLPVSCPCGQVSSHACHPYACCADTDCSSNYTCVNHTCTPPVVVPQCTSDSNCSDTEYCSNGNCFAVQPGTCGYITGHMWHSYECCNNSGCQQGYTCVNNTCVLYKIITNSSGFVGTQHEVWVLPAGSYQLSIVTPKGENKTIDTDAAGYALFTLDSAGLYSVSLVKEQAAANVTVNAVANSTPASTPLQNTNQLDLCLPAAIIGIILLLVIIYVIYRRR